VSSTARTRRGRDLRAVVAGLITAAMLVVLAPDGSARANGQLPPATVPLADVIVRFAPQLDAADRRATVKAAGGTVTHDLHLIDGLGARMPSLSVERLRSALGVVSVTRAAPLETRSRSRDREDSGATVYDAAIGVPERGRRLTGRGVGVAVVDTGIAGDMPDFAQSRSNRRSRVRATAVINPDATDARDPLGHGTHVAGIIAGDGDNRSARDPLRGDYAGVAPDARLIVVKIADDEGHATTLDAIYGIQFAVDHADTLGIDVINLSLASTVAESPRTDPLAAAAEAAWLQGLVVVTAAGNLGTAPDAVAYAPGNDPYVLTVGATDDRGTETTDDDVLAPWSSRGLTQTGEVKPDVLAPGHDIVSTLAPGSEFAELCPACVVDGEYFRAGGTSMSAAVASGAVALLLDAHPKWTPDQVKAALVSTAAENGTLRVDRALEADPDAAAVRQTHPVNQFIDATTGAIDYSAASWRAASWRYDRSKPGWAAASWRCDCTFGAGLEPQAASWRVRLAGAKR
jgi:serine protease AprX